MTNLTTPPVPELSSDWIAARRDHLVREITTPHRQPVSRRLAVRGVGALASVGAATAAALVAFGGTGAANAFAGWTATPTTPASGETATALAQCTSRLASRGQSGVPAAGWQAVVTDTRGPFTAMILDSDSVTATCLSGPSFTTTQASNAQGGGQVLSPGSDAARRRLDAWDSAPRLRADQPRHAVAAHAQRRAAVHVLAGASRGRRDRGHARALRRQQRAGDRRRRVVRSLVAGHRDRHLGTTGPT